MAPSPASPPAPAAASPRPGGPSGHVAPAPLGATSGPSAAPPFDGPREPALVVGLPLAESVRRLDALQIAFELAAALSARWIISTPETARKIQLGKALWHFATAADAVAQRRAELDDAPAPTAAPGPDYAAAFDAAARVEASAERMALLHGEIVPGLRRAVDELRGGALSFGDGVTEWALDPVAVRLRALAAWNDRSGPAAPAEASPPGAEARERLRASGGPCGAGAAGAPDAAAVAAAALPPLSLPLTPAREPGLKVCDPVGPRPESFLMFLHSTAFNVEICATEVCAAMLVEHPEAPRGLKLALARQIYDEVRHAESLLGRLGELGGRAGQFPIDLRVWRSFRAGESLAEQLVLQHRIGEGGGLDGGALVARQRRRDGDERTARLFEYINADEINHVKAGNRWIETLLGGDAGAIAALEAKARARLEVMGLARPPLPPWVEGRRRAGFGEADVASTVRAWRAHDAAHRPPPPGSPLARRPARPVSPPTGPTAAGPAPPASSAASPAAAGPVPRK